MPHDAVYPDSSQPASLEIAHVLFMDIVAYSQLPMEEQSRLLLELMSVVRQSCEFTRAQERDQLLRLPTGDGMALIFFHDPEASVRCAVEISRALLQHPDLKLRMGIHSGPVQRINDINASSNVSGAGINYAQRVMDCGDAGHILVSRAVAEVIGETTRWGGASHDIGEVEVKHGVRVHLYNFYGDGYGNPENPSRVNTQHREAVKAAKARAAAARRRLAFTVFALVVLAVVVTVSLYTRRAHALTDRDTIVLADFNNTTGDPVFDDTLKQGLSVALSQSPFLNFVPDQKVNDTLRMMGRAAGERLTHDLAREVCLRTNNKAMLEGSISSLGSRFVIGLKAIHCNDGDVLAQEQVQAASKEDVLNVLDSAAISMREKLGESLSTLQKYDTPLIQATTTSLEALQAYSHGVKTASRQGDAPAVPFFMRAIELDANFAAAYDELGTSQLNLREHRLDDENFAMAFRLRDRASEWERYSISSHYYGYTTEEVEKANELYRQWSQAYPRDTSPHVNLSYNDLAVGHYEQAVTELIEAIRLNPSDSGIDYANLMLAYTFLGRLGKAKAAYQQARALNLEHPMLHENRYVVAFLEGDSAEMQRQGSWAMEKAGAEDSILSLRSDTEAYAGHFVRARELSRQAVEAAQRNGQSETGQLWSLNAALREAEVGNLKQARQQAASALSRASMQDSQIVVALALARAGEAGAAQTLAEDLKKRSPLNTLLNGYWLPTILASIELSRNHQNNALQLLQPASRYELGAPQPLNGTMYPVYVRGEVYLRDGEGPLAAAEFQKVLDHHAVVGNFVLGAIAHLQLGRAKALSGDKDGALKAYKDFFALWKDADPDIPILKQANAEYVKLQ